MGDFKIDYPSLNWWKRAFIILPAILSPGNSHKVHVSYMLAFAHLCYNLQEVNNINKLFGSIARADKLYLFLRSWSSCTKERKTILSLIFPRVSCKDNANLEILNQHSQTDTISLHWQNNAYSIRGNRFRRCLFAG